MCVLIIIYIVIISCLRLKLFIFFSKCAPIFVEVFLKEYEMVFLRQVSFGTRHCVIANAKMCCAALPNACAIF